VIEAVSDLTSQDGPLKGWHPAKALIGIRDALRGTLAADLSRNTARADEARAQLNSTYDAYVTKHGPINKTVTEFRRPTIIQQETARMRAREEARMNMQAWEEGDFDATPLIEAGASTMELARARRDARDAAREAGRPFDEGSFDPADMDDTAIVKRPNIDPFMADQEGYRLRSIEHYDDNTGTARKGLIFFESPLTREIKPTINSVEDALLYTLNRVGRPDIDMIAREAGVGTGEVLDRLSDKLFRVPGSDAYETSEVYLSGNVREKLELAQRAAENDPAFEHNVRALERVQPAPLSKADITASLGMPWIPPAVVEQFAKESLGLTSFRAEYQPKLAQWRVTGDRTSAAALSQWGTEDRDASTLIGEVLNRVTPKIYREYRDADGTKRRVLDEEATQAVQDKAIEIKARFREWIWSDDARTGDLEAFYNRTYNSRVAPVFDGSYLTTPGVSSAWSWRPHQRNVIARILQAGNAYMAHGVGAGKTSAMIGAGMEMKRLGLVSKPAYTVPNHMLGQFTKEFYEQYPTARIMVADETRFHTDRRKQFVADVANSDLDAVILTHSSFELLPVDPGYLDTMINDQIDEYRDILGELDKGGENRITRSRIEQQIEALEQRLSVNKNARKDQVYTFEETGIDFLFVDEAHLFRKLSFSTKMGQVKGIDPDGSQAAFDLFAKIQRLEQQRPGRSVVLASGTPITNTMAELYTVQRMMQMGELRKLDLHQFDAWAGAFGDTDTRLEQDPAGGYKPVTRFAKFVNVPELSVMVRQFMDVVTSNDLDSLVVRPKLKGGKRNMVVVDQNPDQKEFGQNLKLRMEAIEKRTGPPKKGDDILLTVINDGRKSAIDMRLIGRDYGKQDSKLERLIDNVHRIWKESKRQPFHAIEQDGYSGQPVDYGPATQMVFADLGVNPTGAGIGVHDYIRAQLISRGVPAREIALMGNFKNTVQKQRLFNDMNEGKVRVLVGSVAKMGTGVNAQRRLLANHNLDAQWYPANDEQRNGRIIRQGNMNPEVELYDYSTKGTYDSQMWQLMETKARFIEGFMRGDPTMRDMEDLGEASQYEQAKALTTADPRIMQLTELRQALDKALLRKGAFERSLAQARREIRDGAATIERMQARIPEIEADIAQRVDTRGDAFEGIIGDITFTERAKFGEAMLEALDGIMATKTVGGRAKLIGEMGGFQIYGEAYSRAGEMHAEAFIRLTGENVIRLPETNSAVGFVSSVTSKLEGLDRSLKYAHDEIEIAQERIGQYTPELAKSFKGQPEIDRLQTEIADLGKRLETESAEPASMDPESEAPTGERQSRVDDAVAVLTGNEIGDTADFKTLRSNAERWYKENLLGQSVTTSQGWRVTFNQRGMKKTQRGGEAILRAIPAIPAILENGRLWQTREGADLATKAMHIIAAPVEIAGERQFLGVFVRETADGRFQYSLNQIDEARGPAEAGRDDDKASFTPALEGSPGNINLFLIDNAGNPNPGQAPEEALDDLHRRLRAVGIADRIATEVMQTIRGDREIAGTFSPRDFMVDGRMFQGMIRIATDVAQDRPFTINHEIIHAMRSLGLFMPAEWAALARRAKSDTALMSSVKRRYRTLDNDLITEEAVADLFAQWVSDRAEKGLVGRAFDRVLSFLSALSSWAQGNGFVSAEGMMRAIDRGTVGARRADTPRRGEERQSRMDSARDALTAFAGQGSTWNAQAGQLFDRWRTAVQDRYLPLLRTQQAIEAQLGATLGESVNPYLGEELMTGRIGTKLDRLADDMLEPLLNDMHAAGIEIEQLETYLYARHAPERNAQISSINPAFMPGEGSGMTDIEARAVMRRIERSGQMSAMERLAEQVDAITDWSLQERIDAGLMTDEEARAWRDTYEHYVPLRGNVALEGEDAGIRVNRSGGGINVRGRESRRAFGRKSQAENILSYVLLQAQEAVVRGETNRVAQKFVRLAERAPDGDFWQVDKVTTKPVMDVNTGLVRYEEQSRIQPEDQDFTVTAKFDGEERRVTMNRANPAARRLADSMRNLTQHQLDWVTQHLGKLNRFLSAVNTSWNPEFVITNAFRDIQTAAINLTGEQQDGIVTGTLRDYRPALVAATKGEFGREGGGEWARWYKEFQAEGGRISFNQIDDIPGIKKKLQQSFAMASAKDSPRADVLTVKRAFFALRDTVGALNGGVENAVRLAAYKNAREGGMSKAQAASLAKNLTVNFNRRGQMGPALNAAYLFFNASMQGSVRIITAMKSPRVRKVLAGVAMAGFAMELLNAMLSAEDDDGESVYDKIADYEKSRNFIIMLPDGGSFVKVPMPYGYNVFANAGRTVAEILRRGGDRWQESGANLIVSVVDAFNPVGGTESLLNFIAPTAIDPIVDLTQNRDFSGRPIQPEQNPFGPPTPDHLNYFSSVGPHWRAVTDTLAQMTGGDDVRPGAIDVSPETLEYMSGVVFGAAGGFVDRIASLGGKALDADAEITANDLPMTRKVLGQKPGWYDKGAYYERIRRVEQAVDYAKGYLEGDDMDGFEAYVDRHEKVLSIEPAMKEAEREMRKIRKARRTVEADYRLGRISEDQWREDMTTVRDAETEMISAFNRHWNEAMHSASPR